MPGFNLFNFVFTFSFSLDLSGTVFLVIQEVLNGVDIVAKNKIVQNGRAVFKWAVGTMPGRIRELLDKNNMTLDDIDYFIPHSANLRILEAIAKDLGVSMDRFLESVIDFGNTSSASIPMAIDKGIKDGKVKPGNKLLLFGFGGGLTYSGVIYRW